MIGFNKPYITGNEFKYIQQAISLEKISGNGQFTKKCQQFFEENFSFHKCLLTHSATAALEMAALLADIQPGDEVIMPSYTFVSTANAFLLRGATIIFCDSNSSDPNISVAHLKALITEKTKAIVVVHYAGIGCDMEAVVTLVEEHNLFLIEDAAQAIDSTYKGKALGSFGHFAAFSFHETKNIIAGEGGMLVINKPEFVKRAEIIWEKGTNRVAFYRKEINKYNWVDIGSSFLPSELNAAFLYAQLENLKAIQEKRKEIWEYYYNGLKKLEEKGCIKMATLQPDNSGNYHIFYILAKDSTEQQLLLYYMEEKNIQAIFHYLPLHLSPYYLSLNDKETSLPNAEAFSKCLVRLPLYFELRKEQLDYIIDTIQSFYTRQ